MTKYDFLEKYIDFREISAIGVLIIVFIYIAIKFLIIPIVEKILDYNLNKKNQNQALLVDIKKALQAKKFELEGIKITHTFELLEELNQNIVELQLHYFNYLNSFLSQNGNYSSHEGDRVVLDEKLVYIVNKVSIYIPSDIYSLLCSLRRIFSCSYIPGDSLRAYFLEHHIDRRIAILTAHTIIENYYQCFLEMVRLYYDFSVSEKNYVPIMNKYKIDRSGNYMVTQEIERTILDQILFWEYANHL